MCLLPLSLPAAFLTAAIILLHTFWGVVFFDACERRRYWTLGLVVGSHLLTSGLVSEGQGPKSGKHLMVGCQEGNLIFTSGQFKTYRGRRQKGESSASIK